MLDPALLRRLQTETDTYIRQHQTDPAPDAWYAGRGPHGDFGPYATPEDALIALLRRLWESFDDARHGRDMAEAEAAQLRAELTAIRAAVGRIGRDLLDTADD